MQRAQEITPMPPAAQRSMKLIDALPGIRVTVRDQAQEATRVIDAPHQPRLPEYAAGQRLFIQKDVQARLSDSQTP